MQISRASSCHADLYQALKVLVASTHATATVVVHCFHGIKAGEADSVTTKEEPLCTIAMTSLSTCQFVYSMALEMLASNLRLFPTSTIQYSTQETLLMLLDLAVHGGFSLQASALDALAALLPEMPFELIPMGQVVSHLLLGLETWTTSIHLPKDHPALKFWQQHMLTCLYTLVGMLEDCDADLSLAETILETLPKLAGSLDHSQSSFPTRLCQVALEVAGQHPHRSYHLTPMLSLLQLPGDAGKAASHALYLILQQLQHDQPQHPMFDLQVCSLPIVHCKHGFAVMCRQGSNSLQVYVTVHMHLCQGILAPHHLA